MEIVGWTSDISGDISKIELQIYVGDTCVPHECHWFERPDLPQEFRGSSLTPGFSAVFSCPLADCFQIFAKSNGDSVLLKSFTKEEVLDCILSRTALWSIDSIQYQHQIQQIMITGWLVCHDESESVVPVIARADDIMLPAVLEKRIRSDVNTLFGKGPFYKSGFSLEFSDSVGPQISLALLVRGCLWTIQTINLKQLRKEQKQTYQLLNMFHPAKWGKHIENYKHYDLQKLRKEYAMIIDGAHGGYGVWRKQHLPDEKQLLKQSRKSFSYAPLISILVPMYETKREFLLQMIDSCIKQTYSKWELCLADGSSKDTIHALIKTLYPEETRIRYQHLETNEGISGNTNKAMLMAAGDCMMFCDHDDFLSPNALYELVKAWNAPQSPDILYTDEDKVNFDGTLFSEPVLKPGYNFEFLLGQNYFNHIFAVKRHIVEQVGGLRSEYDGAQDYDFVLRCCEAAKLVSHVPKILYHWRCHQDSTAQNPDSKNYAFESGQKAIEDFYRRNSIPAKVEMTTYAGIYRTHWPVHGTPLLSIILAESDCNEARQRITASTSYTNLEFCFISPSEKETITVSFHKAAQKAAGDYLLFLSPHAAPQTDNWLEELLSYAQREEVGIVGGKNFNESLNIESAGVILGIGKERIAGKAFYGFPESANTYMGKASFTQEVSAVTYHTMMLERQLYEKLGGFDSHLTGELASIDLCLKAREQKKKVIMNPYAQMLVESTHTSFEPACTKEEKNYFTQRWESLLKNTDPYYNPQLSVYTCDSDLRWTK